MVSGASLTDEPRLPLRRRLLGIGAGVVAWIVYRVLAASPDLAESVMGSGPVPSVVGALSVATGWVPMPVAELIVLGFLARQGIGLTSGLIAVRAGRYSLGKATGRGALRLAQDTGVLVALFYVLWGFQYARPGLEYHLGIDTAGDASPEEIFSLAEAAVEATSRAYLQLHGAEDAGRATAPVSIPRLTPGLGAGWERTVEDLGLSNQVLRARGRPKAFLSTPLVKRLGISGMYFPYTAEALVLSDLPGTLIGTSLGHEMAHQRGFASETDANTLGALVAARSPNPLARYAALFFMERQLTDALRRVDPEGARALVSRRLPGVTRDLEALYAYWEPARTQVGRAANRVNDAMLRSHGVPDGVESYRGSTWVFLALAREHGPEVLFGEGDGA